MPTKAESTLEFINSSLLNGKTVYITTAFKNTKITPKTVEKFKLANVELFKIDSTGDLLICRGKNYDCFCTKHVLLTGLTVE